MGRRYGEWITTREAAHLFVIVLAYGLMAVFFDIDLPKMVFSLFSHG